jgi:hypothetical protein
MTYSQKYTLAYFLQPIDEGDSFHMTEWPPHVTLADVFAVDITKDFISDIQAYIETLSPVATSIKDSGMLGTTLVWRLNDAIGLRNMHMSLITILEKHGAVFNVPEFTRDGFIAHITKQPGSTLKPGDEIIVSGVSLLDLFPNKDWQQRKVIQHFQSTITSISLIK